jgi:hypothetical protein
LILSSRTEGKDGCKKQFVIDPLQEANAPRSTPHQALLLIPCTKHPGHHTQQEEEAA